MKCCENCIYGEDTNDICCTCIGSKYTAKSVEEQSKNTTNNLEALMLKMREGDAYEASRHL